MKPLQLDTLHVVSYLYVLRLTQETYLKVSFIQIPVFYKRRRKMKACFIRLAKFLLSILD